MHKNVGIMIVEGDQSLREFYNSPGFSERLSALCKVIIVASVKEALQTLAERAHEINLIVTSYKLEKNGTYLAEQVRARFNVLPKTIWLYSTVAGYLPENEVVLFDQCHAKGGEHTLYELLTNFLASTPE